MNSVTPFDSQCNPSSSSPRYQAQTYDAKTRQEMAELVIFEDSSISEVANEYKVSRKFVSQQVVHAIRAIDDSFQEKTNEDEKVLFTIPVTKRYLHSLVLGLLLEGQVSYGNIQSILQTFFDTSMSKGTIHNILSRAVVKAKEVNSSMELSQIAHACLDEIFQAGDPVLVGIDANSHYCFAMETPGSACETAWGCLLLDAQEKGLNPKRFIADLGSGLRSGHASVFSETSCDADIWHILRDFSKVVKSLDEKAFSQVQEADELEQLGKKYGKLSKRERKKLMKHTDLPLEKWRYYEKKYKVNFENIVKSPIPILLKKSAKKEHDAIELSNEIRILYHWMKNDILSLHGPLYQDRVALYDFVVTELKARESQDSSGKLKSLRTTLEKHADKVLAFAFHIQRELVALALQFKIPLFELLDMFNTLNMSDRRNEKWRKQREYWKMYGKTYAKLKRAIQEIIENTPRASSTVENYNSRLRNYFFTRNHISQNYLDLLRFFLNHRPFRASRKKKRQGKSPRELMTGEEHSHWLETLGYASFKRSA